MAFDLTTGPGLVQAIADTLNRTDITDQIKGWIRLFEAQTSRQLRIREMLKTLAITVGNSSTPLPTDFLELKSVYIDSPLGKLEYTSLEDLLQVRRCNRMGGTPRLFTVIGNFLQLAPGPVTPVSLELVYYTTIPPLDCTTPGATNFLLTKAPDLYFYGAMVQSAPYLMEDDRIQQWAQLAIAALQGLNQADDQSIHGGSRLKFKSQTFG